MRRRIAAFAAIGLASALAAAQAQDSTNAAICASADEAAVSPEQRIAACTALIDTLKDQPPALAAALTNRGATYWYVNKTDLALKDLDRAVALVHDFIATRNKSFGNPQYNLRRELELRLAALRGMSAPTN